MKPREDLTKHQIELVKLVAQGKTLKDICEIRQVGYRSVVESLGLAKNILGAQTHAGMVVVAIRRGIIGVPDGGES